MKELTRFDMATLRNRASEMVRKVAPPYVYHEAVVGDGVETGDHVVSVNNGDEIRLYEKAPDGYKTLPSYYENTVFSDIGDKRSATICSVLVER